MVAYWSVGVEAQPEASVAEVQPALGATAYLWRSPPRGVLEDPDHVIASHAKTLTTIMDARERLEVEDEDERQKRLGVD